MRIRRGNIFLRDRTEGDIEDYVRWRREASSHPQWNPWDFDFSLSLDLYRVKLRESIALPLPAARERFELCLENGVHIGWVGCYPIGEAPGLLGVGVEIFEQTALGQHAGINGCAAFLHYLLQCDPSKEIYTQIQPQKPAMHALAQKLGFVESTPQGNAAASAPLLWKLDRELFRQRHPVEGILEIPFDNIYLRDMVKADIEDYLYWHRVETEWMLWDAPWYWDSEYNESGLIDFLTEYCQTPRTEPRARFEICLANGIHIGWIRSFYLRGDPSKRAIGIDIPDLSARGQHAGLNACIAFLHYLLRRHPEEPLYIRTWAGNLRMIGLAERLCFEEAERTPDHFLIRGHLYDRILLRLNVEAFLRRFPMRPQPLRFRSLFFQLTYNCNMACRHCCIDAGIHQKLMGLSTKEVKQILKRFKDQGGEYVLFTGGEPTVRRDWCSILDDTNDLGLSFEFQTNCVLLTREKLEKLASYQNLKLFFTSILGATPEKHTAVSKRNNFYHILDCLQFLDDRLIPTRVQVTLGRNDIQDMPQIARLLSRYAGLTMKFTPVADIGHKKDPAAEHDLILPPQRYREFRDRLSELQAAYPGRIIDSDLVTCEELAAKIARWETLPFYSLEETPLAIHPNGIKYFSDAVEEPAQFGSAKKEIEIRDISQISRYIEQCRQIDLEILREGGYNGVINYAYERTKRLKLLR